MQNFTPHGFPTAQPNLRETKTALVCVMHVLTYLGYQLTDNDWTRRRIKLVEVFWGISAINKSVIPIERRELTESTQNEQDVWSVILHFTQKLLKYLQQ